MTFLDSLLNSHPKDPALIDGVRIPVMKPTVSFFLHSIRPKHRMSIWQLDSAFFHEELKELICFGNIKIIGAFSLLDPPLIYCQWLFDPHYFGCSYFFFIIFLSLIFPFEELIIDVSYVTVFDKSGVFLEGISMVAVSVLDWQPTKGSTRGR
jgi:hypothetical protein